MHSAKKKSRFLGPVLQRQPQEWTLKGLPPSPPTPPLSFCSFFAKASGFSHYTLQEGTIRNQSTLMAAIRNGLKVLECIFYPLGHKLHKKFQALAVNVPLSWHVSLFMLTTRKIKSNIQINRCLLSPDLVGHRKRTKNPA